MKHTPRLFSCLRCHAQVVICTHCDRGQIYCGDECANVARLQSKRAAEKRYQLTLKGRMKHALRQRRYRERLKKMVTDHSSHSPDQNGLLQTVKNKAKKAVVNHRDLNRRCCFCKKSVPSWFRNGFLRHHASISVRDLPCWRPP
jgi:hypothetical protein